MLHCREDRLWVYNCLPQKLEGEFRFSLVIPGRDFSGHGVEIDEVVTNMAKSRVILLILSENFLRDRTCISDMNYAFDYRRRYGKPLVVIKLGPISDEYADIDPKIKELLSAKGYVKWPMFNSSNDSSSDKMTKKQDLFWRKVASKVYGVMSSRMQLSDEDTSERTELFSGEMEEIGNEEEVWDEDDNHVVV